jgi:proline iminopeptidase
MKEFILLIGTLFFLPLYGQSGLEKNIYTSDQTKIYTKKSGNGPIILYVHGGPGAWSKSFEDLGGKNLESDFTMIYFDQRGCGRSESPENGNYSLERMIEDIEDLRKEYGMEKFSIMGHSFGGLLATVYTEKYPEHIDKLILLNSSLNVSQSIQNQVQFIKKELNLPEENRETFSELQYQMVQKNLIYKVLTDNPETFAKLNEIDAQIPSDFAFAKRVLDIPEYLEDYTQITSSIPTPTLVFTGKRDFAIGVEHYKSFRFPNQTLVQFETGHCAYYEENDLLKHELIKFLKN